MTTTTTTQNYDNLFDAILFVLKNEFPQLTGDFVKKDGVDTVKSVGNAAKKLLWQLPKTAYTEIKENGLKVASKNAFINIKEFGIFLKGFPKRSQIAITFLKDSIVEEFEEFESTNKKANFLFKLFAYILAVGGGAWAGNAVPDQDIKIMGLGKHRNFMFHSAFVAVAMVFVGKFIFRVLDRSLHHIDEDSEYYKEALFYKNLFYSFSFGLSFGVASHLGIDGTVQNGKAVLFPGIGSIVNDTLLDDKIYLIVNAFLSVLMGKESLAEMDLKATEEEPTPPESPNPSLI